MYISIYTYHAYTDPKGVCHTIYDIYIHIHTFKNHEQKTRYLLEVRAGIRFIYMHLHTCIHTHIHTHTHMHTYIHTTYTHTRYYTPAGGACRQTRDTWLRFPLPHSRSIRRRAPSDIRAHSGSSPRLLES